MFFPLTMASFFDLLSILIVLAPFKFVYKL